MSASISPSVLIVRLDAIGDALTTLPLVAALRGHGYRVGAVLRPVNAQIFARRTLDRVHVAGTAELVDGIAREHYDAALIATEKPEAYRIARAARIPQRIGFENGWGKPLKTLWVRRMCTRTVYRSAGLDARAPHECTVLFKLAQTLLPLAEPPRDPALLRPFVLDEEPAADPRVTLQITGKWERLGATLQQVGETYARLSAVHPVRLIGAAAERGYAERFAELSGTSVELFDDLAAWKAAIAASRALLAPDSGAAHVAGMTGTPVVSCFAAGQFALQSARWSPWAAPHRVLAIGDPAWPIVAVDALESLLSGNSRGVYKG